MADAQYLEKQAEQLKAKVAEYYRRYKSGERVQVVTELNGLNIAEGSYERGLLLGIAAKVVPSQWKYEVVEGVGKAPELLFYGYTE